MLAARLALPCRYQTCVHVDDIQPLYDVSGVQAYCINSRRAVLIHPKVGRVDKGEGRPAGPGYDDSVHKAKLRSVGVHCIR